MVDAGAADRGRDIPPFDHLVLEVHVRHHHLGADLPAFVVGVSAAAAVRVQADDLGDGRGDAVVGRVEAHLPAAVGADGDPRQRVELVRVAERLGQNFGGLGNHITVLGRVEGVEAVGVAASTPLEFVAIMAESLKVFLVVVIAAVLLPVSGVAVVSAGIAEGHGRGRSACGEDADQGRR